MFYDVYEIVGRAALTAEDHAAFRRGVREVAARRFAATGAAGVTMRGIADDLGCSPMKPYRYFRDRGEILDEVGTADPFPGRGGAHAPRPPTFATRKAPPMTHLETFMSYAAAFEQTYVDDDWQRLAPFFTDDAVYLVTGLPSRYELRGRDNIFRGIKRSLDGFDRKCDGRAIVPTAPPTEVDGVITLHGLARYQRAGAPDLELRATITAELDAGRICRLHDHFTLDPAAIAWLTQHAAGLDGSYA
jgi:hypothetical protein